MLQQQHREDEFVYAVAPSAVQNTQLDQTQSAETVSADVVTPNESIILSPLSIQLADSTAETVQSWLDYVEIKRGKRWDAASTLIVGSVAIPWILEWNMYVPPNMSFWNLIIMWLRPVSIPLGLLATINVLRRQSEEQHIEAALPETPTLAWIGPLVDALESKKRRVREAATRLLPRLMLQMRPRDEGLLTPAQWEILGQRLRENAGSDDDLNLAILKMLERVGGDAMIAFVEAAATSSAWTTGAWRVRRAARERLVAMDARLQAEEAAAQTTGEAPAIKSVEDAVEAQRTLNPELAKLLAQLEEQRRGQAQPGMRLGFLLAAYLTILPASAWKAAESLFASDWTSFALWGTAVLGTTQLHRFSLFPKHRELMRKLADYDEVAGVGVLAETLEWPDRRVQEVATKTLVRLLPRLRASDARLLTPPQRACLYRMLTMRRVGRDGALVLAILQALQQVGDDAAVPFVQRLARSAALSPTQRKVRQAAEDCLPYLQNSADMQRASQTLLRASTQETVISYGLLRPAYSVTATEPEELLRAVAPVPTGTTD